jgi:Flp pilus assembly protein TadG
MALSLHRGQAGTAVIEFAFVMVFLLLLTIGITEIGRAFWYYSALQKAARDGARYLSVSDWSPSAGAAGTCQTLVANAAAKAGVPGLPVSKVSCGYLPSPVPQDQTPTSAVVAINDFSMTWMWSLGSLPAPGGTSKIVVEETMPYTGVICDVQGC